MILFQSELRKRGVAGQVRVRENQILGITMEHAPQTPQPRSAE